MKTITVGSRGSRLALAQTNTIIEALKQHDPSLSFEVKVIQTKGDLIQNVALEKIGDKGLFVKEIEQQLLDGHIDLAVHSMKDMPSTMPAGLTFSVTPKREDPRDVLVLKAPYKDLSDLPTGAKIGTGSKRRKHQLCALRSDLNITSIRGNIETRMAKIETEGLDGVILAAAGLIRAGHEEKISTYLTPEQMIPAPAQGALALQIREDDAWMKAVLQVLQDVSTQIVVDAERAFLAAIGGTCHQPIGAHAVLDGAELTLTGLYGDSEGHFVRATVKGTAKEARQLGASLGRKLRKQVYGDE